MQNQENAHSGATEKSPKSLFQKINEFLVQIQNQRKIFTSAFLIDYYMYNNINNTDFGLYNFLKITCFLPQKYISFKPVVFDTVFL
jgi:hypothetical protein